MKHLFLPFIFTIIFVSCSNKKTLFKQHFSKETGLNFINTITEKDSLNILDTEFVYNGGGVTVGDLNNDGLQDIYFAGNQVENKLFINKGNLKFEESTLVSKVQKKPGQWSAGVSMIDINNDGKLDIYVNNMMSNDSSKNANLLFINQGNDKKNNPIFDEKAKEYGLDLPFQTSTTSFFDFDQDGDLDAFAAINFIDTVFPNQFVTRTKDGSSPTRDLLLENVFDENLGHAVFKDVSIKAGIVYAGYSHSVLTHDFNQDGWLDIYVANDYLTNDLIYINNQNGTFTNKIADIFKHQSNSAMGSDVADINNDGKMDFIAMEMLPFENKRKKLMQGANNYNTYLYNREYKYELQYVRNTLQLNNGLDPKTNLPIFSDISFLGGIEATDWSWTPLFADFDNDGFKDLLITNGFPKDVTDNDFGAFRSSISSNLTSMQDMNDMMPEVKTQNFIFKNNKNLTFSDKSADWGLNIQSFTNGTAYADFDNDGDLDIVTNNINDEAFFFENTLVAEEQKEGNFIRVQLQGEMQNLNCFNYELELFFGNSKQHASIISNRGYLSKSEDIVHFGIGNALKVDSIRIFDGKGNFQVVKNLQTNQLNKIKVKFNHKNSLHNQGEILELIDNKSIGLDHYFGENDFIDFNFQKTLPHKFSQFGPSMAVGDINGDGLDDIATGSSSRTTNYIFIQQKNGKFLKDSINCKSDEKREEDLGILLFDADNDNDNDIYLVRGSYQYEANSILYQDILLINDGKGKFTKAENALPVETAVGQVVKAADFDADGDLDLFVGGRVSAKAYPKAERSFLLRNDSKGKDKPMFTDVTAQYCKDLVFAGLISDATFTDFNNDHKVDLVLAGEWMPMSFFQNTGKGFENITSKTGTQEDLGWWTSILPIDYDTDGDMDYVAGNYGKNLYFRANKEKPMRIYAKDFDNNGSFDPFISCYFKDSTGKENEYFFHSKDDMQKQLILIRKKFEKYADFGKANVSDVFSKDELKDALILETNCLETSIFENLGNGKFKRTALPIEAQIAPIFGMMAKDVNQDGLDDILMIGNDFGMEVYQGQADAFNGLVLINSGKNFKSLYPYESNFYVPGDARALVNINLANSELILASQNNAQLRVYQQKNAYLDKIKNDESFIIVENNAGQSFKKEFYFGNTFLGQSTRSIFENKGIKRIKIYNKTGKLVRTLPQIQ